MNYAETSFSPKSKFEPLLDKLN